MIEALFLLTPFLKSDGQTQSWTGTIKDAKGGEIKHSDVFEKQ